MAFHCRNDKNFLIAVYGHGAEILVFNLPAYAYANHQALKG